jgi:hypothetical protein
MKIEERIPYYVIKNGSCFWQPTKNMRDLGFYSVPCGPDGERARRLARAWNKRWKDHQNGRTTIEPPAKPIEAGFVYFLIVANPNGGGAVKIGFSKDPFRRACDLKTMASQKVVGFMFVPGTMRDERLLHSRFSAYRKQGEWFSDNRSLRRSMMRFVSAGRIVHDDSARTENEYQLEELKSQQPESWKAIA